MQHRFEYQFDFKSISIILLNSNNVKFFSTPYLYRIHAGYYSGVAGGVCNDANHVIRSQKECSDGLQVLDITSLAISWTGKNDGIPSGCSFSKRKDSQQSYTSPHFETSTTGLGKGRNDLTPICKKPMGICLYRHI